MRLAWARRLDAWARRAVPAATAFCLVLPAVAPVGASAVSDIAPVFTTMAVFYWTVHRPDLLPPAAVFAVGLFQDMLTGHPAGSTALALLAIYGAALSQRRVLLGKPFLVTWIGFAAIAAGAFLLVWLSICVLSARLLATPAAPAQFAATVACFPLAAWAFVRIHRHVVR